MKHRIILTVLFLIVYVVLFVSFRHWQTQNRLRLAEERRAAQRYAGVTGETITAFDERTSRWIAELKAEKIEETLPKLTDALEYMSGILQASDGLMGFHNEKWRDCAYYSVVYESILSNRWFRKAYEDLQKTDKKQAAELLSKNIRDNLDVLRTMLQEDHDKIAQNEHTGMVFVHAALSDPHSYRPMSHADMLPTRFGRRYAVLTYILLASLCELPEVRPAVEEVVECAKEEYKFFNSVNKEAVSFKVSLLAQSLYNPSLLVTAAYCDPTWKAAEKQSLPKEKLVEFEVVDYQARVIEQDKDARDGLLPVVPHEGTLKIRYYKGITDAEFNDFFGK